MHLDERIMQFLSVCNRLLPKSLSARNYSVTPLGARSGLILQEMANQTASQFEWECQSRTAIRVILFEHPHWKQLECLQSRRDLPSSILRDVHRELIRDPIWFIKNSSTSSSDFLNTQNVYARSLAVMSILGYIIGLGDRHLDNILLDHESGEIVHIDYNICFEKGAQLVSRKGFHSVSPKT